MRPPDPIPGNSIPRHHSGNKHGVSAANVVATIEVPASHHDTFLPETKNSSVLPEERRRSTG